MAAFEMLILIHSSVNVTGKGPMKKYYEDLIKTKDFKHVSIFTMWLSDEDYPVLLGESN